MPEETIIITVQNFLIFPEFCGRLLLGLMLRCWGCWVHRVRQGGGKDDESETWDYVRFPPRCATGSRPAAAAWVGGERRWALKSATPSSWDLRPLAALHHPPRPWRYCRTVTMCVHGGVGDCRSAMEKDTEDARPGRGGARSARGPWPGARSRVFGKACSVSDFLSLSANRHSPVSNFKKKNPRPRGCPFSVHSRGRRARHAHVCTL